MSKRKIVPVSTLVQYVKQNLEANPVLRGFFVEGEISNLRKPYSGHWYFSLKDEKSSIDCVMFANMNRQVPFEVKSGDKVIVHGDLSVYVFEGRMQIIVSSMKQSGIGDLYIQLEQLKQKLQQQGLFDENHKKRLPAYPMHIGVVTGNNTAAKEDVYSTLKKRWPMAKIYDYPCPVQGNDAIPKIIAQLLKADQDDLDVILLVRGGGSIEELWCFNDESLAKTIYDLNTPIVTGIGHEIDFTIADFVSDVRANTPTGAVQMATPDQKEVWIKLEKYKQVMKYTIHHQLQTARQRYQTLANHTYFVHPEQLLYESHFRLQSYLRVFQKRIPQKLQQQKQILNQYRLQLLMYSKQYVQQRNQTLKLQKQQMIQMAQHGLRLSFDQLGKYAQLLDAYSPLKVLNRGYTVTKQENQLLTNIDQVNMDQSIEIQFADGSLWAKPERKSHE